MDVLTIEIFPYQKLFDPWMLLSGLTVFQNLFALWILLNGLLFLLATRGNWKDRDNNDE